MDTTLAKIVRDSPPGARRWASIQSLITTRHSPISMSVVMTLQGANESRWAKL